LRRQRHGLQRRHAAHGNADSVTINWTPPTENTNGSPLINLAGYNIHYGTAANGLTRTDLDFRPGQRNCNELMVVGCHGSAYVPRMTVGAGRYAPASTITTEAPSHE